MRAALTLMASLVVAVALAGQAGAKDVVSTTCGENRCRTATNGVAGIATLPGHVPAPRRGRFYTVELPGGHGWKVVYEARREIVRAADLRARSFLGRRWARLTDDVRPHFARAVRGLAPMRSAPR